MNNCFESHILNLTDTILKENNLGRIHVKGVGDNLTDTILKENNLTVIPVICRKDTG